MGMLPAIGNDISYDDVFIHPLETYSSPGDLAVAISCSGNSPNVIRACEWAKAHEGELSELEQAFLDESVEVEEREKAARERLRRNIAVGLGIGLVVALILSISATAQFSGEIL